MVVGVECCWGSGEIVGRKGCEWGEEVEKGMEMIEEGGKGVVV